MKRINKVKTALILSLLIVILLFSGCSLSNKAKRPVDLESFYIDKVTAKTAKELHKQYKIRAVAFGAAAMEEVECLDLHFQVDRKLSKDEIRLLLVNCVNEMVKNVHQCEGIQPYLLPEGFSEKNVEIVLFFKDGKNEIYYPDVRVAASYTGQLEFRTKIPEQEYGYHTDERESFQEAVAILESQGKRFEIVEKSI